MKIVGIKINLANGFNKDIKFTKDTILFQAPNATGKTLLLSLLTSSAISKSYLFGLTERGIYSEKTIIIEKDGVFFTLYSKVNATKVACSFKLNDKELCTNGLLSNYNELIKTHDLAILPMIDQKTNGFFDLSPIKRREFVQDRFVSGITDINNFRDFSKNKLKTLVSQAELLRGNILSDEEKENINTINTSTELLISQMNERTIQLNQLKVEFNKLNHDEQKPFLMEEVVQPFSLEESYSRKGSLDQELKIWNDNLNILNEYNKRKDIVDQLIKEKAISESILSAWEKDLFDLLDLGNFMLLSQYNLSKASLTRKLPEGVDPIIELRTLEELNQQLDEDSKAELGKKNVMIGEKNSLNRILTNQHEDHNSCFKLDQNCIEEAKSKIEVIDTNIGLIDNFCKSKTTEITANTVKINYVKAYITENEKFETSKNNIVSSLQYQKFDQETINRILSFDNTTYEQKFNDYNRKKNSLAVAQIDLDNVQLPKENLKDGTTITNEVAEIIAVQKYFTDYARQKTAYSIWEIGESKRLNIEENIKSLETDDYKKYKETSTETKKIFEENKTKLVLHTQAVEWFKLNDDVIATLIQLEQILNTNGLPKYLSLGKLMELESRINNIIHTNFTKHLTISFGYSDKKLEIEIKTRGGNNNYESLSGYETSVIKVCSSLAMSDESKDILRLDEVDATFDTNNRYMFSTFVGSLIESGLTKQVFMISHNLEFDSTMLDTQVIKL